MPPPTRSAPSAVEMAQKNRPEEERTTSTVAAERYQHYLRKKQKDIVAKGIAKTTVVQSEKSGLLYFKWTARTKPTSELISKDFERKEKARPY